MSYTKSDIERIINDTTMTTDQKNVSMVLVKRFELVTCKIPAAVRRALNEAVKAGTLGHIKKDGHKAEAYFHPTFDYLMHAARNKRAEEIKRASNSVITYQEYRSVAV